MLQTNTVIHYTFVVQLYRLQFTVKTIKVKQKQKENNKYKTHKKGGIVQACMKVGLAPNGSAYGLWFKYPFIFKLLVFSFSKVYYFF